ncbi:MAG: YraN family protein [Candidatus Kapaibacteriales bacterium]
MKANHTSIGKVGEDIASEFLTQSGYKILKRNFHFGRLGEIDIIAEKDQVLVFFEIKVQTTDSFGDAKFWITKSKQQKLRKVAEGFLYINKLKDKICRFDAIFVDLSVNPFRIDHLENAF